MHEPFAGNMWKTTHGPLVGYRTPLWLGRQFLSSVGRHGQCSRTKGSCDGWAGVSLAWSHVELPWNLPLYIAFLYSITLLLPIDSFFYQATATCMYRYKIVPCYVYVMNYRFRRTKLNGDFFSELLNGLNYLIEQNDLLNVVAFNTEIEACP